jgi:hypothetical protein
MDVAERTFPVPRQAEPSAQDRLVPLPTTAPESPEQGLNHMGFKGATMRHNAALRQAITVSNMSNINLCRVGTPSAPSWLVNLAVEISSRAMIGPCWSD